MPSELSPRIRVLIVEDSLAKREALAQILRSDPAVEVAGMAADGLEAMQLLSRVKADIVTVGVSTPRMCGFEMTRRIMESGRPVPVVLISASGEPDEAATTCRAIEAGAVAVICTPHGPGHVEREAGARKLLQTIKAMSEVKVVRRWMRPVASEIPPAPPERRPGVSRLKVRLIAIGASTGGPVMLQTILSKLPPECDAPILIVQHIAVGFLRGLSEWLATTTGFPVHVAVDDAVALPGHAYLAPDGLHMGIRSDGQIVLEQAEADEKLRPSVAHLFNSVAMTFGPNAAGVLLSGMGRDGADELKLMQQRGALTIAQDRSSCVVFGMPGEAIRLGAASYVLNPDKIATLLASVTCAR